MSNVNIWAYLPLILWFLLSFYWLSTSKKKPRVIASIPSGFASSGVLGTFIGIALGLTGFNVEDIAGSIPTLLEGLKQSFYTSIIGIVLSMVVGKIIEFWFHIENEETDANTIELRKIVQLLESSSGQNTIIGDNIIQSLNNHYENQNKNLANINEQNRLIGNNIVQTLNENNNELAKRIADMNSKELLNAMERSVEIFNNKIKEILNRLIAENFDELNKTVQNMNQWQKENKNNLETLNEANRNVSNHLRETSNLLADKFKEILSHITNLANEEGRLQLILKELENITLGDNQFQTILKQTVDSMGTLEDVGVNVRNLATNVHRTNENLTVVTNHLQELAKFSLNDIDEHFKKKLTMTLESMDSLIKQYLVRAMPSKDLRLEIEK